MATIKLMQEGAASILAQTTLRLTSLYSIIALNGTRLLYLTSHSEVIPYNSRDYLPSGSLSSTARRGEVGLKTPDAQVFGAISSDLITEDDIAAGIYRDAEIIEHVVDYRYPWLGPVEQNYYRIREIEHDVGSTFSAQVAGLASELEIERGPIYTRDCPASLGDADCGVDLDDFTYAACEVTEVVDSLTFKVDPGDLASTEDDWFAWGQAVWTGGDNEGQITEIRAYSDASRQITLIAPTFFGVTVGDIVTLKAGCDGLRATCFNKFDNFVDGFQGWPFLPGTARTLATPKSV